MHPGFQQLLWIAAFVTATPFLAGAAALLLEGSTESPKGAPSGPGAQVDEEKLRE